MKYAKIKFDSDEVCAETIHEISRQHEVTMLRGDFFIVSEPAVAWMNSKNISYELVEWMDIGIVSYEIRIT